MRNTECLLSITMASDCCSRSTFFFAPQKELLSCASGLHTAPLRPRAMHVRVHTRNLSISLGLSLCFQREPNVVCVSPFVPPKFPFFVCAFRSSFFLVPFSLSVSRTPLGCSPVLLADGTVVLALGISRCCRLGARVCLVRFCGCGFFRVGAHVRSCSNGGRSLGQILSPHLSHALLVRRAIHCILRLAGCSRRRCRQPRRLC